MIYLIYCAIHLKCTVQWFWVIQIDASIITVNLKTFSLPQKENLYLLSPPTLQPSSLAAHSSTFYLSVFAYSGHFI